MPSHKVVLIDYDVDLFDITPPVLAYMHDVIHAAGGRLVIGQYHDEHAVIEAASDADVVIIQTIRPLVPEPVLQKLVKCRGLIRAGLGYDSIDIEAATKLGIPVSNVINWCNDEVAEQTLALLFSTALHIISLHETVRNGMWDRSLAVPTYRMRGKTLGLIGYGRIAREVARRLQSFGFGIIAYDPYIKGNVMSELHVQKVEMAELLHRSNFISLHTPLTEGTSHLLNADSFAKMKDGVIIVNTSRGQVIDELALHEALRSGKVAGAGLDVFEIEPLPLDSPLRSCTNVVFTPHVSSYSLDAVDTLYRYTADIAAQILQRRWVQTIVNPDVRPLAENRWGDYVA
ncbi:MAG: C-terminal binding protein [Chloroflexi bacterium]|nr:C-terminal binding protein [Chloroflexota bacterium]